MFENFYLERSQTKTLYGGHIPCVSGTINSTSVQAELSFNKLSCFNHLKDKYLKVRKSLTNIKCIAYVLLVLEGMQVFLGRCGWKYTLVVY